ncbi:MAG: hypothetical protein AAB961_01640 [Patescibacteria group bacterium]
MKVLRFLPILFLILLVPHVLASSQQAYQDYLYQFDVYRQKYSEFTVAKNEYLKFKTLTSQTTALAKTIAMLSQRDLLLRAYLLLLNEKLNEDRGLLSIDRVTYQTLLTNEVVFLEGHSRLVTSIASLEDASETSQQLESHYSILQASMRQTIGGLSLGQLIVYARVFDTALADARALVDSSRGTFSPQKQATIDRWILQITNVRSLYQQKQEQIARLNAQFKGTSLDEQNSNLSTIKKNVAEARQYLIEGTGYLGELVDALRYED